MKKVAPIFAVAMLLGSVQTLDAEPPMPITSIRNEMLKPIAINSILPSPTSTPKIIKKESINPLTAKGDFIYDNEVSWYGPGFYGKHTACGYTLTKELLGVAHRSLPCGTLVDFRYEERTIRVKVVDRGPYVGGRQWDLTGGLCTALRHCFTGAIEFKVVK